MAPVYLAATSLHFHPWLGNGGGGVQDEKSCGCKRENGVQRSKNEPPFFFFSSSNPDTPREIGRGGGEKGSRGPEFLTTGNWPGLVTSARFLQLQRTGHLSALYAFILIISRFEF